MKLILASQSPRRKEILSMITDKFEVKVSHAEENTNEMLTVEEQVKAWAVQKALAVWEATMGMGDRIIIGSDTIVAKDGKMYGKPKDEEEARQMLHALNHAKHDVMTSVCLLVQEGNQVTQEVVLDTTAVYVSEMSDEEIEEWIATGEAYDKAGGYAIQGKFGVHIEKIEGNFFTVVGFPVQKVYEMLKPYLKKID